jgi:hypothetical protein
LIRLWRGRPTAAGSDKLSGCRPIGGSDNEVIDELLSGASTEEELAGPGGLLAQLTKRLVERAMEVELTEHVGYKPHCEPRTSATAARPRR